MGMKPRASRRPKLPRQVKRIRSINRRLKYLRKTGGSPAEMDRLMIEKDELISEMETECSCDKVMLGKPSQIGFGPMLGKWVISCRNCAKTYFLTDVQVLERRNLSARLGQLTIKLGINIKQ